MFGVVVLWVVCGAFCLVFVGDWWFGVIGCCWFGFVGLISGWCGWWVWVPDLSS